MAKAIGIILAGAIAAVTGVSSASAGPEARFSSGPQARLWDGTVVLTHATQQCAQLGNLRNGSLRALYRPRLKNSDPKAAIIVQADDFSHVVVIRATTNTPTLNGDGEYCGIDFDTARGESTTWLDGTYNISVRPPAVTAITNDVRVTGTVHKFGNIEGCTVEFRGAFLRRP